MTQILSLEVVFDRFPAQKIKLVGYLTSETNKVNRGSCVLDSCCFPFT